MTANPSPIDISDMPELARIAEEVEATQMFSITEK
jgi:hypothetical protein